MALCSLVDNVGSTEPWRDSLVQEAKKGFLAEVGFGR